MNIRFAPHQKVIFFDCYQTLVDIDIREESKKENQARAWEYVAKSLEEYGIRVGGVELSEFNKKRRANFYAGKDKEVYHHNAGDILAQVLKDDLGVELPEEKVCSLLFEYHKIARGYARLYPGVAETLAKLQEKNTLSIASYTQRCYTQFELKELGIDKFFSYFVYSSDICFRKTSPQFYERCLEIIGKKAEDCMMIGDNYDADVLVPQRLGMSTIWIKNPLTVGQYTHLFDQEPKDMIDLQEFVRLPEMIDEIWKI